jgi:hypothetical protein
MLCIDQHLFVERLRFTLNNNSNTEEFNQELQNLIEFFSNPQNIGSNFQGIKQENVYEYYTKNQSIWLDVCEIIFHICEDMNFKKGNNPYVFTGTYTEYCFCDCNCFRIKFDENDYDDNSEQEFDDTFDY